MKLAYSSNAYTKNSLLQAIDDIAGLGFAGLEILCDRPHWYCPEVGEADIAAVQQRLAATGLAVSNLNANTSDGYFIGRKPENAFEPALSSPDPERRRWRLDYSRRAIELAARLGARSVCVTSGLPWADGNQTQARRHFVDSLKALCDHAERFSQPLGVEYEPGLLVERAEQLLELIEQVGSPLLGVNLDVGHSFLNGEDPAQVIPLFQGRIWNLHFEDIKDQVHFHLPPGQGELPFDRYLKALQAIDYRDFITLELYTYPDQPDWAGAQSLAYLRPLMARLGIDTEGDGPSVPARAEVMG